MGESIEELKPIAIDYLFEGMLITEDIYNHTGRVVLMSKGQTLTAEAISKLKKFNDGGRNICVSGTTYHALMRKGISKKPMNQKRFEADLGYSAIKEQASDLLQTIRTDGTVTKEQTTAVQKEISHKLNHLAPSLIFEFINAPKPMDEYLHRHSVNVSMLNGLMGKWLKFSAEDIDTLILAGIVHDIGKTKIPSEILDAPRRLCVAEFEVVKMHPIYSFELLNNDVQFSNQVRLAALHHHEKINGTGYPAGLSGENIPLLARITAVSDIYDAMVAKRCYKDGNNPFLILEQLASKQFSDLDTFLVDTFTTNMPLHLIDKPILMSDGSMGIVKFILPQDLAHPLVEINGSIVKTDADLYCVQTISEQVEVS